MPLGLPLPLPFLHHHSCSPWDQLWSSLVFSLEFWAESALVWKSDGQPRVKGQLSCLASTHSYPVLLHSYLVCALSHLVVYLQVRTIVKKSCLMLEPAISCQMFMNVHCPTEA